MSTRQETPESIESAAGCSLGASPCSASRTISEEGLGPHYWNHLRAAEEMARAHSEERKCLKVLLEFYPEMGERTDPISVLLREIFQQNAYARETLPDNHP